MKDSQRKAMFAKFEQTKVKGVDYGFVLTPSTYWFHKGEMTHSRTGFETPKEALKIAKLTVRGLQKGDSNPSLTLSDITLTVNTDKKNSLYDNKSTYRQKLHEYQQDELR